MIYSSWNPSDGKYTYYDAPSVRYGMGDDLPTPVLPRGTAIGVASTEAGRPMPKSARRVGEGEFAKGVIVPLERSGLLSGTPMGFDTRTIGFLMMGFLGGWLIGEARRS